MPDQRGAHAKQKFGHKIFSILFFWSRLFVACRDLVYVCTFNSHIFLIYLMISQQYLYSIREWVLRHCVCVCFNRGHGCSWTHSDQPWNIFIIIMRYAYTIYDEVCSMRRRIAVDCLPDFTFKYKWTPIKVAQKATAAAVWMCVRVWAAVYIFSVLKLKLLLDDLMHIQGHPF